MDKDFRYLIEELYAHTTMTMDDKMFIARKNDIEIDVSKQKDGMILASKGNENVTFEVSVLEDGTVFIFDI